MKKTAIEAYLSTHWKKMRQHFKRFSRTRDPEELHQFRVQVKKIRSFLFLLSAGEENGRLLKLFRPVKKLFKAAGIARDAYIHLQQAAAYPELPPDFSETQDHLHKTESRKLAHKGKKHLQQLKTVGRRLKKHLHPVPAETLKNFFRSRLGEAQFLLTQHDFSEKMHDGRKGLKHLLYNSRAVPEELVKSLHINFTYIDELQEAVGAWHDNQLALAFFETIAGAQVLQSMQAKNKLLEAAIVEKSSSFEKKVRTIGPVHANG